MPLHIDRAAIAARQHDRAQHELTVGRGASRPAETAPAGARAADDGDVAVDVRGVGVAEELAHVAHAEDVAKHVRGASIAALRAAHGEIDPQRANALLNG